MSKDIETYFEQNAVDGSLPQEAMAALLVGDFGDTTKSVDQGAAPTPEPTTEAAQEQPQPESSTTPEGDGKQGEAESANNAEQVILAKDGVNTIPYDKLVEARSEAKAAKEAAAAMMQEMESIKAQLAERSENRQAVKPQGEQPQQPTHQETIDKLEREWHEAMLDGDLDHALKLRDQINHETRLQAKAEFKQEYEAEQTLRSQASAHELAQQLLVQSANEVMQQYPELDASSDKADQQKISDVVEYRDFLVHAKGMTPHEALSAAASRIMGSTIQQQQPVEQKQTPAPQQSVRVRTPTTMSDIPGGTAPTTDEAEAFMQMSDTAKLSRMMSMTPDKIADFLGRHI